MAGESIQQAFSKSTAEAIRGMINRTLIVEWGTIKDIPGDGVVEVLLSVTDRPENTTVITCVLVSPCAKGFALNVKPSVGDKVIVFSPRRYDSDMFAVSEDTEAIIDDELFGYNKVTCVAMLCNQFNESYHKNYVTVDNGVVSAKLGKVEVTTSANGDITVANGKATVNIDKDGNVSVEAQGKYTIKNSTTDLLTVMSDLNTILKGLKTTGSSSAQTISPDTVTLLGTWESSELKSLLNAPSVTP